MDVWSRYMDSNYNVYKLACISADTFWVFCRKPYEPYHIINFDLDASYPQHLFAGSDYSKYRTYQGKGLMTNVRTPLTEICVWLVSFWLIHYACEPPALYILLYCNHGDTHGILQRRIAILCSLCTVISLYIYPWPTATLHAREHPRGNAAFHCCRSGAAVGTTALVS